jgi:hypothetical protein
MTAPGEVTPADAQEELRRTLYDVVRAGTPRSTSQVLVAALSGVFDLAYTHGRARSGQADGRVECYAQLARLLRTSLPLPHPPAYVEEPEVDADDEIQPWAGEELERRVQRSARDRRQVWDVVARERRNGLERRADPQSYSGPRGWRRVGPEERRVLAVRRGPLYDAWYGRRERSNRWPDEKERRGSPDAGGGRRAPWYLNRNTPVGGSHDRRAFGAGCRRGTPAERIHRAVNANLRGQAERYVRLPAPEPAPALVPHAE